MNKIIIRSAYYTDHATKRTAVALALSEDKTTETKVYTSTTTYGQMWLQVVARLLGCLPDTRSGDVAIAFVSGQPQCVKMAEKIERMFCELLTSRDGSPDRIKDVVLADGKYKRLPNDRLYEDVLTALWKCYRTFDHFVFEQHHKPSQEAAKVFNAAKNAVASLGSNPPFKDNN